MLLGYTSPAPKKPYQVKRVLGFRAGEQLFFLNRNGEKRFLLPSAVKKYPESKLIREIHEVDAGYEDDFLLGGPPKLVDLLIAMMHDDPMVAPYNTLSTGERNTLFQMASDWGITDVVESMQLWTKEQDARWSAVGKAVSLGTSRLAMIAPGTEAIIGEVTGSGSFLWTVIRYFMNAITGMEA